MKVHAFAVAVCVAMGEAKTEYYVEYQKQVVNNAKTLAKELMERGYHIVAGAL